SESIIELLNSTLPISHPTLKLQALRGEYLDTLKEHSEGSSNPKFILFLGANIGNMTPTEAETFCRNVGSFMNAGDQLLIGFDLKKNPHRILSAYNDRERLTRDFNLNLLSRINKELQGNFDLANFAHYAT